MAFRYDEAVKDSISHLKRYALSGYERKERYNEKDDMVRAENFIDELIKEYGPPISGYPHWHPLFNSSLSRVGGFDDHTVNFRDAILFAPYGDGDEHWKELQEYAKQRKLYPIRVTGELFHHENCNIYLLMSRNFSLDEGEKYINQKLAVASLLYKWEKIGDYASSTNYENFTCWETWDTMHEMILGTPCGKRSSLFVDEVTGQALKNLYANIGKSLGLKEYRKKLGIQY